MRSVHDCEGRLAPIRFGNDFATLEAGHGRAWSTRHPQLSRRRKPERERIVVQTITMSESLQPAMPDAIAHSIQMSTIPTAVTHHDSRLEKREEKPPTTCLGPGDGFNHRVRCNNHVGPHPGRKPSESHDLQSESATEAFTLLFFDGLIVIRPDPVPGPG